MIFAIIGIVVGILLGMYLPITYSPAYSLYVSMAILACADSVVGGLKARVRGNFDSLIFITGFVTNSFLAALLTYAGEKLGVPLYYAAIVTFGWRLFDNLSVLRRHLIKKLESK